MPTTRADRRICWVVTDGRRGIENQALGLAEAVGRLTPLKINVLTTPLRAGVRGELAARLRTPTLEDLDPPGEPPDVWIGCGRASLAYSERARGWFADACLIVQVQDPRRALGAFDLVIPPRHDALDGPNVFSITGSPNRVSTSWLDKGRAAFEASDPPPGPRAAILIGGDSKRHRLTEASLATLLEAIDAARAAGWSLLVTTSRRTPDAAVAALRERLAGDAGARLWTSEADGPNPYAAFLAGADVVMVTRDSTNMITEAATAGKPTLLLPMDGEDGKLAALYEALKAQGAVRDYAGEIAAWTVEPLRETERAAAEVVRRLNARQNARNAQGS